MKDFQAVLLKHLYSPVPSESESDENIEDLLTEYQHYLDRAHKQKQSYEEKAKTKNRIPLRRQEKYSKIKPFSNNKYEDYLNSFSNTFHLPAKPINNQLDLFVPLNPDLSYFNKVELSNPAYKNNQENRERTVISEKKFMNLPSPFPITDYHSVKQSCICKDNRMPCNCNCKHCLTSLDTTLYDNADQSKRIDLDDNRIQAFGASALISGNMLEKPAFSSSLTGVTDNDLNIHIKVDIQLPKILENILKFKNRSQDKTIESDGKNSKEVRIFMNSPVSKFNFPVPFEIFGLKKPMQFNKDDSTSLHKIIIHKKKKTKLNNSGNKKHKKKIITFHNIKVEPQHFPLIKIDENNNSSYVNRGIENIKMRPQLLVQFNHTQIIENATFNQNVTTTSPLFNESRKEESKPEMAIIAPVTIFNKTDKFENSIETDYINTKLNISTDAPQSLRSRRSVIYRKSLTPNKNNAPKKTLTKTIKAASTSIKENDFKTLTADAELLYWPNNTRNYNSTTVNNITEIILDRENKKVKLNISQESILKNRSIALEQAIFGNVDWNDVDTVAPVFMSFMGKYITGVLTFCSQKICHSMKCSEKICIHRMCLPVDRFNQKGHCAGSNTTDSVATMETIMDLPSNIAFEVVDILQDKMLGKMFGKVTLCINAKCISLVASKKNVLKAKCSIKELNALGHLRIILIFEFLSVLLVKSNTFKSKNVYINPWDSAKKRDPSKIIHFNSIGDISEENISSEVLVNLKRIVQMYGRSLNLKDLLKENNMNIENPKIFQHLMQEMYAESAAPKKLKILTNCIEHDTFCRFLACPDIDKHCVLCEVNMTNIGEGRGIGSTIWGWITYPFTWWSSGSENDNDNKVESTTSIFTHDNNIEIAKHNVTVWCNDQTCTTMKCDKNGCLNLTCNIYDTDMSGVCREYTIKPEDSTQTTKPTSQVTEEPKKTTEATSTMETSSLPANPIETSSIPANTNMGVEDRPLELEAVLSSTVNDGDIKLEEATD
ncbi:unnamed protein product [Parnassius apollo]|uniref:(apollo) hypothetical protein n=1 Tax=Parnassius apollo TaxID=110799 RepID=A0A8S3WXM4_PARAO|nr:unnamed protein product [Parnassius apollo]